MGVLKVVRHRTILLAACKPLCASSARSWQRNLSQYVSKIRHLQRLKDNSDFCQRCLDDAKFVVFYGSQPLLEEGQMAKRYQIAWKVQSELKEILKVDVAEHSLAILDCEDTDATGSTQKAHFAIDITGESSADKDRHINQKSVEVALTATAMSMRKAIFVTSAADSQLIARGHAVLQWHNRHQFCPNCGSKSYQNTAGSRRDCHKCSETSFPTMSPVAITLVTNDESCLVARQPQFPKGMYSALAGFCEPGETLEDAVQREVAEEVGLDVDNVTYSSSQHWPFPSSALMLACYASVKPGMTTEVILDTTELEEARWLHRNDVRDMIGVNHEWSEDQPIWLPPSQAIAHQLLKSWAYS